MYTDIRSLGAGMDLEELISTLKRPWKTMNADMDTALTIISNHAKTEFDLEQMPLLNVMQESDDELYVEFPDWQQDIEDRFLHQYGLNQGRLIFNKVMMRLYQMAKGTEQQLH